VTALILLLCRCPALVPWSRYGRMVHRVRRSAALSRAVFRHPAKNVWSKSFMLASTMLRAKIYLLWRSTTKLSAITRQTTTRRPLSFVRWPRGWTLPNLKTQTVRLDDESGKDCIECQTARWCDVKGVGSCFRTNFVYYLTFSSCPP
jgi:hypothetical protein